MEKYEENDQSTDLKIDQSRERKIEQYFFVAHGTGILSHCQTMHSIGAVFLLEAVIVFSITIQHKVSQLANVVHRRCGQGYCGRAQAAACCGGFGQLRGIRPANKQ